MKSQLEIPKTIYDNLYKLNVNDIRLLLTLIKGIQFNETDIFDEIRNLDNPIQHPILTSIFKHNSNNIIINKSIAKMKLFSKLLDDYQINKEDFDQIKYAKKNIKKDTQNITVFDKNYTPESFRKLYDEFKDACQYYAIKYDLYEYIMITKLSIPEIRMILFLITKNAIRNPYGRIVKVKSSDLLPLLKLYRISHIKPILDKIINIPINKKLLQSYTINTSTSSIILHLLNYST